MSKFIYVEPYCYVRLYNSVSAWLNHIALIALGSANLFPVYSYGILTGHWRHKSEYFRHRCLVDDMSDGELRFYKDNACSPCDVHAKYPFSCKDCSLSHDEIYLRFDDLECDDLPLYAAPAVFAVRKLLSRIN